MKDKKYIQTGIRIRRLPFYWRVSRSPKEPSIAPNFLPIALEYNKSLGVFQQKRNKKVLACLETIYQKEPNIGHNQEASNWKFSYGNDLYDFILRSMTARKKQAGRILEIGAGGCVILEKFKNKGYDVLGIDPSPFSRQEGRKRGIEVICEFYPSKKITGTFDLIYHSNVLEHSNDPLQFLKSQYNGLNDGGILVFAVPDCTDSLFHGDISILYHQHLTFFDKKSLARMMTEAGFVNVDVAVAGYGGNLYCVGEKGKRIKQVRFFGRKPDASVAARFIRNHKRLMKKISRYLLDKTAQKESPLGIYAPLRVLPYLAILDRYNGVRFFDDTSYWHRLYFDGVPIVIENFDDLTRRPVSDILIMSPTFGSVIAEKLRVQFGSTIRIKKLTNFYE